MKRITTYLLFIVPFFLKGQTTTDTLSGVQKIASDYLMLMYADKNFDAANKMLNANELLEMQDYYVKRNHVTLIDTALTGKIKYNFSKLYSRVKNYKVIAFFKSDLVTENGMTFCSLRYKFSEVFDDVEKQSESMIVLVSNNNGITWTILDYRIKAICDRVEKGNL